MAVAVSLISEIVNPLDKVERLAERRCWTFDRATTHEVTMLVDGGWSDFQVSLTWHDEAETLSVACAFDARIAAARRDELSRLIGLANTQLLSGHFELWSGDGTLVFRNALILSGGAQASEAQCEMLIRLAVESCQRYFPAVQFVVWAGRSAEEALDASLFETVGEA